jgi:hypothetical protein
MFARLLAAFCLVTTLVGGSRAASLTAVDSRLVVYLSGAASQPAVPLDHMKWQLEAIMTQAGFRVEWLTQRSGRRESPDAPFLAVVEFEGICARAEAGSGAGTVQGLSLANTAVSDGHVLPFSTVSCGALNRTLSSALAKYPPSVRDFLFGRAMARVLAHELYHVLAGTTEHAGSGMARTAYSSSDLLSETFHFEPSILALLRSRQEVKPPATNSVSDDATGR